MGLKRILGSTAFGRTLLIGGAAVAGAGLLVAPTSERWGLVFIATGVISLVWGAAVLCVPLLRRPSA